MNISIILGHPYTQSFNHAIAQAAADACRANGHTVRYHDLYEERFDPIITGQELATDTSEDPLVELHCREIRDADGIIVVHPNWWGQPPAILKGWIDRVLRPGVAYGFPEGDSGGGLPIGLLRAERCVVFNTSNTPEKRELEVFGDPLERIWKDCVMDFCGVKQVERTMFRVIADSTQEDREGWLSEAQETVSRNFPPSGPRGTGQ